MPNATQGRADQLVPNATVDGTHISPTSERSGNGSLVERPRPRPRPAFLGGQAQPHVRCSFCSNTPGHSLQYLQNDGLAYMDGNMSPDNSDTNSRYSFRSVPDAAVLMRSTPGPVTGAFAQRRLSSSSEVTTRMQEPAEGRSDCTPLYPEFLGIGAASSSYGSLNAHLYGVSESRVNDESAEGRHRQDGDDSQTQLPGQPFTSHYEALDVIMCSTPPLNLTSCLALSSSESIIPSRSIGSHTPSISHAAQLPQRDVALPFPGHTSDSEFRRNQTSSDFAASAVDDHGRAANQEFQVSHTHNPHFINRPAPQPSNFFVSPESTASSSATISQIPAQTSSPPRPSNGRVVSHPAFFTYVLCCR